MKAQHPQQLPILERRAEIEAAIARHQVVIVCGATGSGKTTQLPQICFEMGLAKSGVIGHTQPRRLAARAVAARIAEERGVRLGALVGVKVRFEDQTGRDTRIKVMTDGTLLAELSGDPELRAYSTIIIDEAHERSLNVDFLLGYLRRLLPRRPDLKVIITSATIDPAKFARFFGGEEKVLVIEVSGRMYPVDVRYTPGAVRADENGADVNAQGVADAVDELLRARTHDGDVLVFLPGEREIRAVDVILKRDRIDAEVLPLFGRLTSQEQDRIFHPGSRRRVILATNVAETSLTVPGIRYVVDTGLARVSRYDPARKVQTLPVEPISRASADQRAGRCGRVAAGVCVRLYGEDSYCARAAFTEPEIKRSNLAAVVLQMRALGLGPVEDFEFLDAPDPSGLKDAYETLFELGAIDAPDTRGALTDTGRAMSRLPVDPRIARMLLAAEKEDSLAEVLILAAALSIQDPRERPMSRQQDADRAQEVFRHPGSDFLTLLTLWDQYRHAVENRSWGELAGWCREHFLSAARMREWSETQFQLSRIAREMGMRAGDTAGSASEDAIHRALLTGLITNVACREGEGGSFDYRSVRGGTVQIFPGSVLFKKGPKWIMAAELVQTTRLYARTVARVDPKWIEELSGHMFRRQISDPHLDASTGEPSAWERITIGSIVVVPRRRAVLAPIDPVRARDVFVREGLAAGKFAGPFGFVEHNARVRSEVEKAGAKLRRANVAASADEVAAWFASRVPEDVRDPATLSAWLARDAESDALLRLPLDEALRPEARPALDAAGYPEQVEGEVDGRPVPCPIGYALAPGKDEDGVTLTVPLGGLEPLAASGRTEWLVPGMLTNLVQNLIKTLPKHQRSALEAGGPIADVGASLAGVLTFGQGSLAAALSEAASVLRGVEIEPSAWSFKGLPAHLRMRVRAVDEHGNEVGADRDIAALLARLEGRLKRAREARARHEVARSGITDWDFRLEVGGTRALVDAGDSVSVTLSPSEREAAAHTALGVRRLFALACRDELDHHLGSLSQLPEMSRQYSGLGSSEDLRRALAGLIAERTFLFAQAPVRTREEFEARLSAQRGRLAVNTREVVDAMARTLEARARVAQRLAGGTPRVWAASIADIREHAAYLMPRGFLAVLPWERARHYPRWAEGMRARLMGLREEGTRAETDALATMAPRWKRFTAWVAATMSRERGAAAEVGSGATSQTSGAQKKSKAALPQTRRTSPAVNVDAGEWALGPGRLPPPVERYRWALEDLRVTLLTPADGRDGRASAAAAAVDTLWRDVEVLE